GGVSHYFCNQPIQQWNTVSSLARSALSSFNAFVFTVESVVGQLVDPRICHRLRGRNSRVVGNPHLTLFDLPKNILCLATNLVIPCSPSTAQNSEVGNFSDAVFAEC